MSRSSAAGGLDNDVLKARLEQHLTEVHALFVRRYEVDLSQLEVVSGAKGLVVRGSVVVPKQLRLLKQQLSGCIAKGVLVNVEVDSTATNRPTLFVRPANDSAPIVPTPTPSPETIPELDKLITEWLPSDGAARVLHRLGSAVLVQLVDGSVGWAAVPDEERFETEAVIRDDYPACLEIGETVELDGSALDRLLSATQTCVDEGLRYRLGGRRLDRAVDCSSFVQLLLHQVTGRWLPRHSSDQMKVGSRVARIDVQVGDFIFARARRANFMHVGIVVSPRIGENPDEAGEITHACRLEGRVIRESLATFFERYRFLRAQRMKRGDD